MRHHGNTLHANLLLWLINNKNHFDVVSSICGNGYSGTDDLHSLVESFLGEEAVPKQTVFIFGEEGALAGVGFPCGTEAALAGEENHSTYRRIIYILIIKRVEEKMHTSKGLWGEYGDGICEDFFFLSTRSLYIPIIFFVDYFFDGHVQLHSPWKSLHLN